MRRVNIFLSDKQHKEHWANLPNGVRSEHIRGLIDAGIAASDKFEKAMQALNEFVDVCTNEDRTVKEDVIFAFDYDIAALVDFAAAIIGDSNDDVQ